MTRRAWSIVILMITVLCGVGAAPWIADLLDPGSAAGQRPSDAQRERLAAERLDRGDRGAYTFMAERDDGSPVRYDPCTPIHVRVNEANAPEGASRLVRGALDELADATGLVFTDDGATDEDPQDDERRGTGDGTRPPVLIVWTTPAEHEELKGDTAGVGGSVQSIDRDWYETGSVLLDAPQLSDWDIDSREGATEVKAVILHELAHVVGLDHVDDPLELMYPRARPGVNSFGPGDLAGLSAVGAGGCREY